MWSRLESLSLLAIMIIGSICSSQDLGDNFHVDIDGISISAGTHHACALEYRPGIEIGGPVRCWGYNHHGQSDPPMGTFIQISAGTYYTCGITLSETVACWGMPINPPIGRFLQISVGEWHVCGILKDGSATCWGRNDHGQSVVPKGEFLQISAGQDTTCGLRSSGAIVCWGEEPGRVAHNTSITQAHFKQVSAGSSRRVCGLKLEGDLLCWGTEEADKVLQVPGPFVQISSSPYRTCAIKADQRLWCLGGEAQSYIPDELKDMEWSEVSVGGDHSCAISEEGFMHCFGRHMTLFGSTFVTSPEDFQVA